MNKNLAKEILQKHGRLVILVVWLITTLLYLKMFGIVTNLEAEKYINEAHSFIETGSFSASRFWFYSITIFIIVVALKLKIGLTGAFIIQAALNLYAYQLFYKALSVLFNSNIIAFLLIGYLLFFWPYQNWVVFLYSESAFFSLILILFSVLVLHKPVNLKNIFLLGGVLVLVIMARPLGILFTGSCYLYLFFSATHKWKKFIGLSTILLLAVAYYIINTIFSTISDWHITQAFEQESIICGLPSTPPYAKLDLTTKGSPIFQLLYYLTHNFSHFLHFVGVKLNYFFLMARPYYSRGHNYFLFFNTIFIYALIVSGLFIKKSVYSSGITIFLTSIVILYTATIMFQCDDYHNRFILSIYPFFVILSSKTLIFLYSHFFENNK